MFEEECLSNEFRFFGGFFKFYFRENVDFSVFHFDRRNLRRKISIFSFSSKCFRKSFENRSIDVGGDKIEKMERNRVILFGIFFAFYIFCQKSKQNILSFLRSKNTSERIKRSIRRHQKSFRTKIKFIIFRRVSSFFDIFNCTSHSRSRHINFSRPF